MSNIIEIADILALHSRNKRLMGLDLGTKTIGIAISDVRLTIAMAEKEDIFAFVLGLPLNMDGSEGPRVQATRAFVRSMANLTDMPFLLWDERLSTVAAEEAMLAFDVSRKKRAEKIDAVAAAFILQGALDRLQLD